MSESLQTGPIVRGDNTLQVRPRSHVWDIGLGILVSVSGNAVYKVLTSILPFIPPLDFKLVSIISLLSFFIVSVVVAARSSRRLRVATSKIADCDAQLRQLSDERAKKGDCEKLLNKLGVVAFHDRAEETTRNGLEEAKSSYWWLGTSAYYVICSPLVQERKIEMKRETEFVFMTVDPECPAAVAAQSQWEHHPEAEVVRRIVDAKTTIERLAQKGVNIVWECHSAYPTFRVVVVDRKKVLVSFYEQGKSGPEGEQLELDADGLLGTWFILFFEKSRADAKRMRIARKAAQLLMGNANLSKDQLVQELQSTFPGDETSIIKYVVAEF